MEMCIIFESVTTLTKEPSVRIADLRQCLGGDKVVPEPHDPRPGAWKPGPAPQCPRVCDTEI